MSLKELQITRKLTCIRNKPRTIRPTAVSIQPKGDYENSPMKESCVLPEKEEIISERLSDYEMITELGRGSYAVVKEWINKLTEMKVAIKEYEKKNLVTPQKRITVSNEIKTLSLLKHKNIVRLYNTIEDNDKLYLVMEVIKGQSLEKYIQAKCRLQESEAISIFKQILEAIAHCHEQQICHRDLKTENILITPEGTIKLIDFGFATISSRNERLKVFCGTPCYMSPEIVSRKKYLGANADIWSLGILYYFMLSGSFPFHGKSLQDLFRNIYRGKYTCPDCISSSAKDFISRMLQVHEEQRATAKDVNSTLILVIKRQIFPVLKGVSVVV